MNPKIQKAQQRLQESKLERERKKARYDAHIVIVEGHRENTLNLERQSDEILTIWKQSDDDVVKLAKELQILIDKEHERTDEQNGQKRQSV